MTETQTRRHPVIACWRDHESADAVGLGALIARVLGEPLVLASAYRYDPAGLTPQTLSAPDNARRALAAAQALQGAQQFARQFARAGVDVREQIVPSTGDVATALAQVARDSDGGMLVLGRDTQGHVARSLIPRAPCPVLVAPRSVPLPRLAPPRRIGVAFDGSPTAISALVVATRLALASDARLQLLTAGLPQDPASEWRQAARRSLAASGAEHAIADLGGEARDCLTEVSQELDLLVCGSRGHSRPVAAILGSVSAHLVAHACCPVIVVPPTVQRCEDGRLGLGWAPADAPSPPEARRPAVVGG